MKRKHSSERGKKESGNAEDFADIILRQVIGEVLEVVKEDDPKIMEFMEEDPSVILEEVRGNHGKRGEEGNNVGDEELEQDQQPQPQPQEEQPPQPQPQEPDDDAVAVLPKAFQKKIQELNGKMEKLVIQKKLTETDLNKHNNNDRFEFCVPESEITNNFLTQEDVSWLKKNKTKRGWPVCVLEPSLVKKCNMCFKKSYVNDRNLYSLISGWNEIVENNNLKLHDTLQLWSFRVSSQLWFAFVKL